MLFGLRTQVGPGNHVLDWGPDPPWKREILGERAFHCKLKGHFAVSCANMAEMVKMAMEMPFGLWTWMGPRNHVLDGGRDPPMGRGNFWGKGCPLYSICRGLYKNGWTDWFAFWVVDLGGPKKAQVQSYSHGGAIVHNFNCVRQAAPMNRTTLCRELCKTGWTDRFAIWLWVGQKKHKLTIFAIGATWRILLNRPSVATVRFWVKLLSPLLGIRSITLSSVLGFHYFSVSIMRMWK